MRVPIVPGSDPRMMYGNLHGRGVRGVVLEAFGVGNIPVSHTTDQVCLFIWNMQPRVLHPCNQSNFNVVVR